MTNGDADAAPGKKRAREQESDHSSGSEDEEEETLPSGRQQLTGAARKRRRNVLPVIKRNQRCGHCQTCLNPRVYTLHALCRQSAHGIEAQIAPLAEKGSAG